MNGRTERRLAGALLFVFVAAHVAYYALGVRFDERPLTSFWQVLDVDLLRTDLARSLFYLHSQPPLWNLYLGIVLKAFPVAHAAAFALGALATGLALALGLVLLVRRLGASTTTAIVASALFVASPSFMLHEQLLFYACPLAAGLVLSAILLDAVVRKGGTAAALGLYATLVALAGTWGLFHLAYILIVTAGLLILAPARRRVVTAAALPALLLVGGLYAKNLVVFGHFAPSTWIGMNFARITIRRLPSDTRDLLIRAGVLSPIARIRPFAPLTAYPSAYAQVATPGGAACLREPRKSTGEPNFNHLAYVALSEQYLRDGLVVVRTAPRTYLGGVARAWADYFSSTSRSPFLAPNSERARFPVEAYDRWLYGRAHGIVLALSLAWLFGMRMALGGGCASGPERVLALYLCFNIAWVALVGNSLEVGENDRFRFVTDPLSVALLALALERLAERLRGAPVRSEAGRPSADTP